MSDTAPYVVGSDTSEEAAESLSPQLLNRLESIVLRCIRMAGLRGATDDEIEVACGLRHQTASARRRELVKRGLVGDSTSRRFTRSGRRATVWVCTNLPGVYFVAPLPRPSGKEMAAARREIDSTYALANVPKTPAVQKVLDWMRQCT